jgi:hypothetical protein
MIAQPIAQANPKDQAHPKDEGSQAGALNPGIRPGFRH